MYVGKLQLREGLALKVYSDGSLVCEACPDGGSAWYEDPTIAARELGLDEEALSRRVIDLIREDANARRAGLPTTRIDP